MNYQIIALTDDEIMNEDVWSAFDKKCSETKYADEECIAVQLRVEMGGGVPLMNWLEKWQEKFQKAGKSFYVISDNPVQLESMELSHPDQNLNYVSSIDELEDRIDYSPMASIKVEKEEKTDEVEKAEEEIYIEDVDYEYAKEEEKQDMVIAVGDTVTIAGEYICGGCGIRRMWMKGKEVTACNNPECFEPSNGWKLDFDLF